MKGNITRRGEKSWRIKFDKGRDPVTRKRIIEYVTVRGTKRDAQAKLNDLLSAVNNGTYVEKTKVTVADHMRARLAQWQADGDISPKTAERYGELVENQIVPHIGNLTIQQLDFAAIENWQATLRKVGRRDGKGGIAARTIGHAHRILGKALDDAIALRLVFRNEAKAKGAPKVDSEEIVILNEVTLKKLLAGLPGHALAAPITVSLFTGMRRGELLALRWSHVDLDGKTIRVVAALEETRAGLRFKEPKTQSGTREVSLPDIVVDALRDHRRKQLEQRMAMGAGKMDDDALVFPTWDWQPRSPRRFSKDWATAALALKVPEVTLQALRHTHASMLIDQGLDVVAISKRLGHASPAITLKVYAHLFRKDDGKAAAAINAALANLGR